MNHDQTTDTNPPRRNAGSAITSVASDIRNAAVGKFGEAVTEARSRAEGAKSDVADEVGDVASALRRASEELRGGSAQERTFGMIAGSLADASDYIRDKDFGDALKSVSRVARDNPLLFLGGAALLGFAASRYAKASGDGTGTSHTSPPADRNAQENRFVSEGNPNTEPMRGAP